MHCVVPLPLSLLPQTNDNPLYATTQALQLSAEDKVYL